MDRYTHEQLDRIEGMIYEIHKAAFPSRYEEEEKKKKKKKQKEGIIRRL